jgi:hypothetical protein
MTSPTGLLPDLASFDARSVDFCIEELVAHDCLASATGLRAVAGFGEHKLTHLGARYRSGDQPHSAVFFLYPRRGAKWHVRLELRLEGDRRSRGRLIAVHLSGRDGTATEVPTIRSSSMARVLHCVGECLAGARVTVNAAGRFRLPRDRYAFTMALPTPLARGVDGDPDVDILGVRLGRRDGSESITLDTDPKSPAEVWVAVRTQFQLDVGEGWVGAVVGELRARAREVAQPIGEA